MPSTAKLRVAIYENRGGIYKHWSLFVDGPTDAEKFIFHIMGSSMRFRFEMRNSDANDSNSIVEMITLCIVDTSKIEAIKDAAQSAIIHNEAPGYNCQDYVLELLDDLEKKGIIDGNDADYQRQRNALESKQEGLA